MKTIQRGFIVPLLLVIIAAMLLGGGAYLYTQTKQSDSSVSGSTTSTLVTPEVQRAPCADFDALSQFVLGNIEKPDSQNSMQDEVNYITKKFLWKRNSVEPFVSYPAINGIRAFYGNDKVIPHDDIVAIIKRDSDSVGQTIGAEAQKIGMSADALNTQPFRAFLDRDQYIRTFGFRNGADLYSVILEVEGGGHQAPSEGIVTVTCGRAVAQYDKVYDALKLKADSAAQDAYHYDYVAIGDVSSDGSVYEIYGNPSKARIADYYYFDGSALKLVSSDSSPAACSVLEAQKVGLGMRCADSASNAIRTVTYAGSASAPDLAHSSFLVSTGQVPVTGQSGTLVYFWISAATDLQGQEKCSIDFGDGHTNPLFENNDCAGRTTSKVWHLYVERGTHTPKLIGTLKANGQSTTEILTRATVTTTN
ncbi:MAG: hypothetical protein WCT45_03150 [Candidatus Paceibacterota bacterium]|jgi:hypothetical protein